MDKTEVDAVAEAWASMDRKIDLYLADKNSPEPLKDEDGTELGYYLGYQSDAAELIKRVEARGFKFVPIER